MLELALAIANMKKTDCTSNNLINIFAKNGVYWTERGKEIGFDTSFSTKNYHVALMENDPLCKLYARNKSDLDKETRDKYIIPGENDYENKIQKAVGQVRKEIRTWLEYIVENNGIDYQRLKGFLDKNKMAIVAFSETDNPFQPNIGISYGLPELENYIIAREFIWPIFKHEGDRLSRLRQCPECNDFFFASDIRSVYCSRKCRNTTHNKKQKKDN